MSDWQVGDLAVCVDARPCPFTGPNKYIVDGRTYTVRGVVIDDIGETGLRFFGVPDPEGVTHRAFHSRRFRKIRPDEREACEPEFVTLLKRSKRKANA